MTHTGQSASNSQKAALLIQALGHERAEEILTQLPPAQAEQIRQAMRALGTMPNVTKRALVREVRALVLPQAETAVPYLATISPARAAALLAGEPARVVALLLVKLPTERQQAIHSHLPASEQHAVRSLCADITPPAEMVSHHLEQALRAKAEQMQFSEAAQGCAVQEMFTPTLPESTPIAPEPARSLTFATLSMLDRKVLRDILAGAAADDIVLALRGVNHACAQRLLLAMPIRLRACYRTKVRAQAPVRLRDIVCAQKRICALAQDYIAHIIPSLEDPVHA